MIQRNGNKRWLLRGAALIACLVLTGCYPDGKMPSDIDNKIMDNDMKEVDNNASYIECELAEGLYVKAELNINQDGKWKDNQVLLKNWDIENISTVLGNGRKITETKTMPNMHNDKLNDQYIYFDDRSMLIIQQGDLQFYTQTELNYSYLGYLYETMPYLTDQTLEKYPETDIPGIDKQNAIEQVKRILQTIGVEVSDPRVYSLTYERLEENTDYTQIDPNGNAPHQWSKEDAVYAIAFKGTLDSLPITEVGYRSGPAAGERIVGIIGKQGLIAFQALNIYDAKEKIRFQKKY